MKRIVSLAVALLMLAAASITVNRSLFGHDIAGRSGEAEPNDSTAIEAAVAETADGGSVIHTAGLPSTVNGYAGPVPLDIYIGADGRIARIEALPNSETPGFFRRAAVLLDAWVGKTPAEAEAMTVDAVSGATYTSLAIISNVTSGLEAYTGLEARKAASAPWKLWIALGVTLIACVVPLFVHRKAYHTVQMIANIAVLGFWCGQFLDYAIIMRCMAGAEFALPAALLTLVMLVAAFIYPLFGRPQHYCNHICPLGSAQQLVGMVCGYKIHISKGALKGLDIFRRALWAALMLLLWADCLTGWMDLELFQAFKFESASWWIIGAALVFVGLSAIVSRPYCRFVCPTGSLLKRAENIG